MKFEYCCESMKIGMYKLGILFNPLMNCIGVVGFNFNYCPFCGEKIEVTITEKVKE